MIMPALGTQALLLAPHTAQTATTALTDLRTAEKPKLIAAEAAAQLATHHLMMTMLAAEVEVGVEAVAVEGYLLIIHSPQRDRLMLQRKFQPP
jgi:hypothetical protein